MSDLAHIFEQLELLQYLENFVEEGFDTWETVLYITESDLDALNVKLGHRRRLQREIAHARGISFEQLLSQSGRASAALAGANAEPARNETASSEARSTSAGSTKRKYRRHPKPDENAPERPPSAYVIFSNQVREELRPQNLSFTDIAKIVGERWQNLAPDEKEPYETRAATAKEIYNQAMSEYKKTASYREYSKYLADFKAKNAAPAGESKRTRLEKEPSRGSSASAGSPAETIESPTTSLARPLGPPSAPSASPPASNTPQMTPHLPVASPASVQPRAQFPRIIPMEPRDTTSLSAASSRRTIGTPTASLLRHDTSRSSISSTISVGSNGSSSAFTPITPVEERGHRVLPRPHHASSTSSLDNAYGFPPPLSASPPQELPPTHMQPLSPQQPGAAPMKRLSLSDDTPPERPAQRPRSNPSSSGIPPPTLPPPSPSSSQHAPGQSQDRSVQGRLDPLSVLALAGNMMDRRSPDKDRPP